MADAFEAKLFRIHVASETQRYRLLEHAALHGAFLAADAEMLARGTRTRSGTARTNHAKQLVKAGLVRRKENPVRYAITGAGTDIFNTLRDALRQTSDGVQSEFAVAVVSVVSSGSGADRRAGEALASTLQERVRAVTADVLTEEKNRKT